MKYRDLLNELQKLNEKQLDMTVIVEDDYEQEYYPGYFEINAKDHLCLDEDYPVIRF